MEQLLGHAASYQLPESSDTQDSCFDVSLRNLEVSPEVRAENNTLSRLAEHSRQ